MKRLYLLELPSRTCRDVYQSNLAQEGEEVKISTIAKMLNVRQPSVVQMLKLNTKICNIQQSRSKTTEEGEKIGFSMMRNSRF